MYVRGGDARTKAFAEHWSSQWSRVVELGEKMEQAFEDASEEQRARMATLSRVPEGDEQKDSMTMEEARELVEQPIQGMLSETVMSQAPLLFETPFMILETPVAPGFITSDDPCVWFDPARHILPPGSGAGGLVSPTIEITLPLSPKQMLTFTNRHAVSGTYLPVHDQGLINALNRRTRSRTHKHFVANRPELRAGWFQKT